MSTGRGFTLVALRRTEIGACNTETSQQATVTKATSSARPGQNIITVQIQGNKFCFGTPVSLSEIMKFEFMKIHLF